VGLAAASGLIEAQIDYATYLYLGQGIARDVEEAAGWYWRAAQAGNPVAQNRYAKLLAVGEGVEMNRVEAAKWRALARRQGLTDAQLDNLLSTLTPAQLAEAEELARFWPSLPPTRVASAG
jgi:TPR repeat protein